ncbi:MAG TPA: hypothetical protein DEG69_21505 [Flavobacteriaceae bacterium]|nr:hypothetical protein [Flavobacteriaceae bacterium]
MSKLFITLCVALFAYQADSSKREIIKPVLNYKTQPEIKNLQRMEKCFEWKPLMLNKEFNDNF